MTGTRRALGLGILALVLAGDGAAAQDEAAGKIVYDAWCVECHGPEGRGDGSAAASMLPRPRDFERARYQIRTTASGELPTDDDILQAIRNGLPGTTMPGWPNLSDRELRDVVAYVKSFSRFFAQGPAPEPMDFGSDPGGGAAAIEAGAQAYLTLECEACHGTSGRGDGTSAPTLEDARQFPIRAADLTEPWVLNGGSSAEDIHTRVLTGLDGTPMPSAIEAMNAEIVTPDEVWQLAHYVASLGPDEAPRLREVVRVGRAEAELPSDGADPAWTNVERYWFPLSGQVIEAPRNFAPTVDGVYVQGLHDGTDLVLRVQWNDPSESPDPSWDEWQARLAATLDLDGAEPPALDSLGVPTIRPPDALAIQFPFEVPDDAERPYFLMGSARDPVYLWSWSSTEGLGAARARGLGSIEQLEDAGLQGAATWEDGQWTLYARRPIAIEGEGISFTEGATIPTAFFAWDGSSLEQGSRGSISTWYYVLLEPPASSAVLVTPLIAMLLTGALGLVLVRRAQNRGKE